MKKFIPLLRSYSIITVAAFVYALSFNCFYVPNQIAYGGATGIAQMINRLFGVPPVGVLIILINIPLFLLAWRFLGGKLLLGSLYAVFISSIFIDLIAQFHTFSKLDEPVMASIFGGVTLGLSAGVIFRQGATMGGSDIAVRLIRLKIPTLSIGQILLYFDLVVICSVALVFQQVNSALSGILALYISTKMMDRMLYGTDPAKVAYIISEQPQEIAQCIVKELHRGVTILNGSGAWTGNEKRVLMCAFKNRQIVALKRRVKEVDPAAFLIVCEAYEVLGDGFLKFDPKQP